MRTKSHRLKIVVTLFSFVHAGTSLASDWDTSCDLAPFPSQEWTACEARNLARTGEAPLEQLNPVFIKRSHTQQQANIASLVLRGAADPSWITPPAWSNTFATPLCAAGAGPCVGDPFRYPSIDGKDGKNFYTTEAEVTPVVYYDRDCARISGHVWRPRVADHEGQLPAIVIKSGSIQANEALYWWAAQELVRAGYLVLTSDPRGQGRSDVSTPTGGQGGNIDGSVFYSGLVDDIDFLLSGPNSPYPHEAHCAGTYPTITEPSNPFRDSVDPNRIGIAGHSYGAAGVTWVQSYDGEGSEPWPGQLTPANPVRAIVAWDALGSSDIPVAPTVSNQRVLDNAVAIYGEQTRGAPPVVPRVPALGFTSEYGAAPSPFTNDPERDLFLHAYREWAAADMPVYQIAVAGSTHLDYSPGPALPATSWCPKIIDNACSGGWGKPLITALTIAWFDRWLKKPGEAGYADADERLLDDAKWAERLSIHYSSARRFPLRGPTKAEKSQGRPVAKNPPNWEGDWVECADIRLGCP